MRTELIYYKLYDEEHDNYGIIGVPFTPTEFEELLSEFRWTDWFEYYDTDLLDEFLTKKKIKYKRMREEDYSIYF